MCPICWATALASCGGIVAISVLSVAGNDKPTVALAAVLGLSFLLNHFGVVTAPWYLAAALLGGIVARVSYLIVCRWSELLLAKAWLAARQFAVRRCPNVRE
jgi:hypothetical protein